MKLKLSDKWYRDRAKAEARCTDIAAGMSVSKSSKKPATAKAKKATAARKIQRQVNNAPRTRAK